MRRQQRLRRRALQVPGDEPRMHLDDRLEPSQRRDDDVLFRRDDRNDAARFRLGKSSFRRQLVSR